MYKVSIILPTYNRVRFLPEVLCSIEQQEFRDWELIVVDDGSTDNTKEIVNNFRKKSQNKVSYIYQDNKGPGAARNKGLDYATGIYIAFCDSDDIWLPHHLKRCVNVLDLNPDIDWVFGASKIIEFETGKTLNPNHFYEPDGRPRAVRKLRTKKRRNLYVIEDKNIIKCALIDGLRCGFQNSVIRHSVFKTLRIDERFKIGEDQIFIIHALKKGFVFAYFDDIHVLYRVHSDNLTAATKGSLDKTVRVSLDLINALESIKSELNSREKKFLYRRLSKIYFWNIGYPLYINGYINEALTYLTRGIRYCFFDVTYWKTYLRVMIKKYVKR